VTETTKTDSGEVTIPALTAPVEVLEEGPQPVVAVQDVVVTQLVDRP
jgi:hypothetical protein